MVLDDLNSELVPRWIQVLVLTHEEGEVLVEDRQPDWDNASLLAGLKPAITAGVTTEKGGRKAALIRAVPTAAKFQSSGS